VSLTPRQRAQVLYLYHVEAVSLVIIALMTELSISVVRRVVHKKRRQDVPTAGKAAAMHPSSKGRIERQIHGIRYDNLLVSKPAAPSPPPPGRRHRRERRHDRT
jgi:hypothetical protein